MSGDVVHTFRIRFGKTAMPWQETAPMFERRHVAQDLESGEWTTTELRAREELPSVREGYRRRSAYARWVE